MTRDGWEPVIGLEIHVQLSTRTKMFCACALSFGEPPNTRTCPVCLGHPGTLPTLNAEAVHYGLMIGMALDCEIAPRSIFHRKNYFYPDLPKGYQISQYDIPLASSGLLAVPDGPTVRIHRAHMEEDAAKLIHHGESGRIHGAGASVVDYNRGGTPLVEIVTEPDLRSAADARAFAQLLRTTLKQIGVSDVNMEEGSLRVDANVSVRPAGTDELRTKTELKNMNSFRFLERGMEAEIERQIEIWESGGSVVQETIHFDPVSGSLTPLRSKEEVHDYRYFPEPDLLPVAPTEEMLERARAALPELPTARLERYVSEYGLPSEVAGTLVGWAELGSFFEESVAAGNGNAGAIAQWTTGELVAFLREHGIEDPRESKLSPVGLADLVGMVESRTLSRSAAKDVLAELTTNGGDPAAIVQARGLGAIARHGRAGGDRRARDRGQLRRGRADPQGQVAGGRRDRGRGDEGDQGPRRRRRGQPHHQREAGDLGRGYGGRRGADRSRLLLRSRHRGGRQDQGQLVLRLVPHRAVPAGNRADRGPPVPLRAQRAAPPLPALRLRAPDRRPGLHGVRRGHGLAGTRGRRTPARTLTGDAPRVIPALAPKTRWYTRQSRARRGRYFSIRPICGDFPVYQESSASAEGAKHRTLGGRSPRD